MPRNSEILLCQYHYDALNRLVDCAPSTQPTTQRFYLKNLLATEIEGAEQRSVMLSEDHLLAQLQRQSGTVEPHLLATDQQRSVLNVLTANRPNPLAYTPYGHRPLGNGLLSLLGFNGERPDPVTGWYLLGNGYRPFNPVLMCFTSPDSWSPFGGGGLNAYAYCVGDPVNQNDPTGHTPVLLKRFLRSIGLMSPPTQTSPNVFSRAEGQFRNPMARSLHPHPNSKTPAWTTQDRLAFAGTEARAVDAADLPSPLTAPPSSSPNTSPQLYRRARSNANVYDARTSRGLRDLTPRFGSNNSINSTSRVGSPNRRGSLPPYTDATSYPLLEYVDEGLPDYAHAIANQTSLDLSERQNSVRRGSQSTK
ncbi:RHS repeat-associated core domain-containing protein [Pseudomonas izuensis]|uniref:RHS repeat-associated core domain-containing protein n=1 Tax=Pseudomonas izuensis TaxID=2684212 RepID=UPI00135B9F34|nr:RHS repeat-associated core domain-containing protein [Pseudomonas izuensis]